MKVLIILFSLLNFFNIDLNKKEINLKSSFEEVSNIETVYGTYTVLEEDKKVEELVYGILRLERIKNNYPDKNAGVLLTGRTGTGKTKIVSILGQCLNRPVFVIDATQLSVPGYVGMSIEDFFSGLERVKLNPFFSSLALNGAHIYLSKIKTASSLTLGQKVLMYTSENKFFALGEVIETDEGCAVKPVKMFGICPAEENHNG